MASCRNGRTFEKKIEQLWRDLWAAVTCIYYDVLHYLEEEGFLSIVNETHLFCCHFVFLPRLQDDLEMTIIR
ncbi:hypothetical protein N1851_008764 [Merluccius polli]|uniref:Integrase core domain-containing protein n=1 Tax=Merluccius polli TaxID=89951 RepID=A0AA47N119_MERPO|nr:hypothetical protein N1851_008764 [Merluccius polli]